MWTWCVYVAASRVRCHGGGERRVYRWRPSLSPLYSCTVCGPGLVAACLLCCRGLASRALSMCTIVYVCTCGAFSRLVCGSPPSGPPGGASKHIHTVVAAVVPVSRSVVIRVASSGVLCRARFIQSATPEGALSLCMGCGTIVGGNRARRMRVVGAGFAPRKSVPYGQSVIYNMRTRQWRCTAIWLAPWVRRESA